ncbi:Transmembrane and coiled-coil domains protein 1 [Triplophysa tibetana]|uniref:Transmembrane and coiled-coil domains protein 1 n=1 Tax=Triplophysa tibetana TaxID=1572043 RepID=A0A5A9NZ43_9TELE|nr:Transmembrane and coiled-coil domains protein 1 [Triplophysa tibetana]
MKRFRPTICQTAHQYSVDPIERLAQAALSGPFEDDGSLVGSEEGNLDPQRTQQAIAQLQQKILKLKEQLRIEQAARDDNVAEYLKLAGSANDKQQSIRIKQVFEKRNQKSAANIAPLQRKLEHYHRRLRDAEHSGVQRQPKDVLRDMQQALLMPHILPLVQWTSKPREIASLIRHKFGSADNINILKHGMEDVDNDITTGACSLGSAGCQLQSGIKFGSDEDCSSATSGSVGANSVTGAPGGPPSSRWNSLERAHSGCLNTFMKEVEDLRGAQARLDETVENLKGSCLKECSLLMQTLQEERFRCERLEEQLNDLSELHQNEILNLKQVLASMEEKIAYQSNERVHDLQEALEACQTRISKMELQQVVQLEGLENTTARTLLGKVINVLVAVMAVVLVFVSTVANCVIPLMKTQIRSVSSLLLFFLFTVLWRNWDNFSAHIYHILHTP